MRPPLDTRKASADDDDSRRLPRARYLLNTVIQPSAIPAIFGYPTSAFWGVELPSANFDRDVTRLRLYYQAANGGPASARLWLWRREELYNIDSMMLDSGTPQTVTPFAPYPVNAGEVLQIMLQLNAGGPTPGLQVYAETTPYLAG